MGKLEKLLFALNIPMPRAKIALPQGPELVIASGSQPVTVAQAAAAFAALAGKHCSETKALTWAKKKRLLPPESVPHMLTWPWLGHMLYRFAWAARVNIPLISQRRVFDLAGWEALPRWSLTGLQWCLSTGLLEEGWEDPVTGTALHSLLRHYLDQVGHTRQAGDVSVKIQLFGDSITDDSWGDRITWVSFFSHRLGAARPVLVNNAYGGGVLTAQPGKKNSMVRLMPKMLHPDCDCVVVFGLSNDYASGVLGLGQPEDDDPRTIWGAIGAISPMVGDKPLLFVPSPRRFNYQDKTYPVNKSGEPVNPQGWSLPQMARTALDAAAHYGAQTLDLCCDPVFSGEELKFATIDGLHPNELGDILIAARIYQKLSAMLAEGEKYEEMPRIMC